MSLAFGSIRQHFVFKQSLLSASLFRKKPAARFVA
jgi:hypothetical protein